MALEISASVGHAEKPSNDGWFHCVPTGRARIVITGPADEIGPLARELRDRGLSAADVFRADLFHDGPGRQSCAACKPDA